MKQQGIWYKWTWKGLLILVSCFMTSPNLEAAESPLELKISGYIYPNPGWQTESDSALVPSETLVFDQPVLDSQGNVESKPFLFSLQYLPSSPVSLLFKGPSGCKSGDESLVDAEVLLVHNSELQKASGILSLGSDISQSFSLRNSSSQFVKCQKSGQMQLAF